MSGHSKWANIKHRKDAQDKKRGKTWSKLIREVTVAAREGGGDASANPRLRLAMDRAFANNMPKDTVERAVARGAGGSEGDAYVEIRYEGYGPGGTAVMVDCMTDNRNRTAADVRHAFTKYGGNMGTDGSVAYLFTKRGILSFEPGADEDRLMEAALEAGAEDVISNDDGSIDVLTTPETFTAARDALAAAGLRTEQAEVTYTAATYAELNQEDAERLLKMVDVMEDLDDVQEVHTNADIAPEILAALG